MKLRPDIGTAALSRPRPRTTDANRPYWAALAEQRVVIQRCDECRRWVHYPRPRCPYCGGTSLHFEQVDGRGTVYTFTVARQPTTPHFADDAPQIIAVVELDIGIRLTTTLVAEPDAVRVGAAVEPQFDHADDGPTLLQYRLSAAT